MMRDDSPMSADSPDESYTNDGLEQTPPTLANGEKPRVRADGPGGSDVKPGARIACLECRSAKIRCSAPNDGKVPCKRCARHDKECVFEKHRRGRKPGRPNLPKDKSAAGPSKAQQQLQQPPQRHVNDSPQQQPAPPYRTPAWSPNASLPPASYHPLPSPYARSPSSSGGHLSDYFSRPLPPPPPPPPPAAPGIHNGHSASPSRDYAAQQQSSRPIHSRSFHPGHIPHFPSHDSGAALYGAGGRSIASPGLFDNQGLSAGLGGFRTGPLSSGSNSRQQGFFSPPLSAAVSGRPSPSYPMASSSREESYTRWGPHESGSRTRPAESMARRPSDPPAHAAPSSSSPMGPPQPSFTRPPGIASRLSASRPLPGPSYQRSTTLLSRSDEDEEDEEQDELVDEDDVGGDHHDQDVLSRPLQLLAYASTAAARKQTHGGFRDPRSVAAAATLGLISSPRQLSQARRVAAGLKAKAAGPRISSTTATAVDAPLPAQKIASVGIQGGGGAEPSTLENGNWEYKAGRVRPIKTTDGVASPMSGKDSAEDEVQAAKTTAPAQVQQAIEFASAPAAIIDDRLVGVPSDEGPHLGKRRRSDDEPLPLPPTRRSSMQVDGVDAASAAKAQDRRPSTRPTTSIDEAVAPTADEAPIDAVGASRKGYFRFSLYSSKLDVDAKDDPITLGIATSKEMEDLFDFFFNKINPSNFIFDPFLHSLAYIRARSKFLLTIIASISARMSEGCAELTERLESHWRDRLLPAIVTGGYKSVEISQGFLLASLFHRPTHIIVEDRAWQYLGMAIRTATEVGVNIALAPSVSVGASAQGDNHEQVARRVRNRQRLWKSLLIAEGTLSTQFGRPCTLSCTDSLPLVQEVRWNREDFALPEDAALVCQVELRKLVEKHTHAFEACLAVRGGSGSTTNDGDRLSKLASLRNDACRDLESWRRHWCPAGGMDEAGVGGSMAMGAFLVRWSPYSRLVYNYWRCHLNSVVLQAAALRDEVAGPVAHDSMVCARELMDTLLDEGQIGMAGLPLAPNAVVVMATYAAVSALRMTKMDVARRGSGGSFDAKATFDQVAKLASCLEVAGRTPAHRDGAAAPYGIYLRSVLALFDTDSKSTSSVASGEPSAARAGLAASTSEGNGNHSSLDGISALAAASHASAGATSSGSQALDEAFGNGAAAAAAVSALAAAEVGGTSGKPDRDLTVLDFATTGASIDDSTTAASAKAQPPLPLGTALGTTAAGNSSSSPFPTNSSSAAAASLLYPHHPQHDGDSEEVWEYLTGAAGAGGVGSATAAAAAALWPSTGATAWGGGSV